MAPRKKQHRPNAPDGRPYTMGELVCAALAMQAPLDNMPLEKLVVYICQAALEAAEEYAAETGNTHLWYELNSRSWTLMICGVLGQRTGTKRKPDREQQVRIYNRKLERFIRACKPQFTLPNAPND